MGSSFSTPEIGVRKLSEQTYDCRQ